MKAIRCALMALACYVAFWGAAHIGALPELVGVQFHEPQVQASRGGGYASSLGRLIPLPLR